MSGSKTEGNRKRNRTRARTDPKPANFRGFIAADLTVEVKEFVAGLQADLRRFGVRMRWVRPANLHLTLRFLGNVAVEDRANIAAAMQRAGARVPPFELNACGLGVFPGIRRPRVVWVGLDAIGRNATTWSRELATA